MSARQMGSIIGLLRRCVLMAAMLSVFGMLATGALAQTEPAVPPQKVQDLLKLLGDPEVQKWIDAQKAPQPAPQASAPGQMDDGMVFTSALMRIHQHFSDLAAAIPGLPAEVAAAATTVGMALQGYGLFGFALIFAVFVAAGFAAQWLFRRWTTGLRAWIAASELETVRDRLIAMAARLVYGAGSVAMFALGSIGAFLVFSWPPLLRPILLGYLMAVLIFRLARVVLDFLFSPPELADFGKAARFRVLPVSDPSASFWVKRLSYAVGWFAFGWVTVVLLSMLGFTIPSRQLIAYALGLVLLGMGIEAVWRRPVQTSAPAQDAARATIDERARTWLLSAYFVFLFLLWIAGAMKPFWLLVVLAALPAAVMLAQRAVNNVFRPPGSAQSGKEVPSVLAAIVERGVRAGLIIAAVVFLAHKLDVDFTAMTAQDTFLTRVMRGALSAIVILLVADFIWHVAKTLIDKRIASASSGGEPGTELARRNSRIRTLLPIMRNVLMIVVAIVALLMALSSLGVQIGPLIAGAGIVGVAIGFGAQTVVKDVISGVFYLLDDAFRVGEYIQSGSYKGTVESFSLRSVKLRHHRGYVYTVPFSDLGAVQNMSRDWVIEKITLTLTYDSDIDKARKIVKKIGLELAQDPEFARSIIEPLKMQGVDQFGDTGMLMKMKLKTRPGEQFTIKRRALMLIKQAFDENGIKIAVPTVQVSGDDDPKAAAAHRMRLKQQADAAAANAAGGG
ncbi:mechanosensitive ion channel family protein [Nordella sp. HKS 07]|uniref:mechanosensitive ion channel family protein n=1 Tax=Nordella sp. HKS 07 TaxID=2712222 RepID=UPI001FEE0D9A|nr:mechanosensitive ion channel family protein [Nordella sp. HKS 07]